MLLLYIQSLAFCLGVCLAFTVTDKYHGRSACPWQSQWNILGFHNLAVIDGRTSTLQRIPFSSNVRYEVVRIAVPNWDPPSFVPLEYGTVDHNDPAGPARFTAIHDTIALMSPNFDEAEPGRHLVTNPEGALYLAYTDFFNVRHSICKDRGAKQGDFCVQATQQLAFEVWTQMHFDRLCRIQVARVRFTDHRYHFTSEAKINDALPPPHDESDLVHTFERLFRGQRL